MMSSLTIQLQSKGKGFIKRVGSHSNHSDKEKEKLTKENEDLKREISVKDTTINELKEDKSRLWKNLTQVEEDFHDQLTAMQSMCQTIQQRNDILELQLEKINKTSV